MVMLILFFDSKCSSLSANQASLRDFFVGQLKTGAPEITY